MIILVTNCRGRSKVSHGAMLSLFLFFNDYVACGYKVENGIASFSSLFFEGKLMA